MKIVELMKKPMRKQLALLAMLLCFIAGILVAFRFFLFPVCAVFISYLIVLYGHDENGEL